MRPAPTLASELGPVGVVDQPPAVTASGKRAAVPEAPDTTMAPRRRISRPAPRFVMGDAPKRPSRLGLIFSIVAFAVVGAAAVWYFKFGPGADGPGIEVAPPPAAASPVSDSAAPTGVATPTTDTLRATPPVANAPPPAAPPASPSGSAGGPDAATVQAMTEIDRLSDTLVAAIQSYQERSRMYESGLRDCTVLARGLVAVENGWVAYEAGKKRLTTQLDATRAQRDLLLFSSVDSVSAHYDRSTCRRP
jgi:hypothetical protein